MHRFVRLKRLAAALLFAQAVPTQSLPAPVPKTVQPDKSASSRHTLSPLSLAPADPYDVIADFVEHDTYTCADPEVPTLCAARRMVLKTTNETALRTLNHILYRKLLGARRFLWCELPANIQWYKTEVSWEELERQTHVQVGWPKELSAQSLAEQKKFACGSLILVGTSTEKLMILEGNTRFQQWVANGRPSTGKQTVFVGLSPDHFHWYPENRHQKELPELMDWEAGYKQWS